MRGRLKLPNVSSILIIFLTGLVITAFVHFEYLRAEETYRKHLEIVTFHPHINTIAMLETYVAPVNDWLRVQEICVGCMTVVTAAVLILVVRQRNDRLKSLK